VLGPLWLLQLAALAAMQWLSPRDTVYPWSGAIVFGSLLVTLGSGLSPRWSAAILATGLSLPTIVLLARLGSASDMPVHAFVAVAVVAAARGRERLARAEFVARSELERLQQAQLRAQREGFVEELHDGAAAGIARAATLLDRASRSGDPAALRAARSELDVALREARSLMNDLDDPSVRWTELAAELRRELLETAERAGLQGSFEADGVDEQMVAEPLAHALRRVAREGATNAVRHARASVLRCALRRRQGSVEMTLDDDGCGARDASSGRGLGILEARVRRLGGTFSLQPREAGGTQLRVTLPEVAVAGA
jgi:signal transduction histidine kinase